MPFSRVAVVFDNTFRPETTGGYCLRALGGLVQVEHFLPAQLDQVPRHGFDLYLRVDDGLDHPWPADLHPCAWWAIDTHMRPQWYLERAGGFDLVLAAQRDGAELLQRAGFPARWLPLACDPDVHARHDIAKRWDVCFVGNLLPGPRLELVGLLRRHFPDSFVGRCYFEEMARTYSASRLVFNRSVGNDVNMRVFEAVACGSLLLSNDLSDNGQAELFRDGEHLATYQGADELLDKARFYLAREEVRERIAAAGRAHALAGHTYRHRMETLLAEASRRLERTAVTVPGNTGAAGPQPARPDARDPCYFEFDRPEVLALVPASATRVLDIGCASGRLGAALKARQPTQVVGVEVSAEAARAARSRLDRVLVGDIEREDFPLAMGSFDAVVCADVLEHLRDPEGLLRRIRVWLCPGGTLVASIPNARHHSVVRGLLRGDWSYEPAGLLDRDHLRFFTRREIEKMLFRTGFALRGLHATFRPGELEHGQQAARGEVTVGRLHMRGLSPAQAQEFFVYQYLLCAQPRPPHEHGLTSIVVVTSQEEAHTRQCVQSILERADEPVELIFIDSGATDSTLDFLRSIQGARLISTGAAVEFAEAAAQGVRTASGNQVVLLEGDTVVTTGWLTRLLRALSSDPSVGLVGPTCNRGEGPQRVNGAYEDIGELDGFSWDWGTQNEGRCERVEALGGFCLVVRREVIERIGPRCLDADYGLWARRAGYRSVVARDVFIHQWGQRPALAPPSQEESTPAQAGGEAPGLTSIVIVTYNELACTRLCLDSIRARTAEPYELIFVDNASSDGTPDYLRGIEGAKLIANAENRGFPAGANQGIRAASGRQVLLLNNDTVVTAGWLTRLLRALHSDPCVGLVGPTSNCVSGVQQVPADYQDIASLEAFAQARARQHDRDWGDTDRLVGFCLLIRREVIDRVGLLDERFGLGCFEDDDYSRRTLQAGFRAVVARDAFIHHFGSRTFLGSGVDLVALLRANGEVYRKKWQGEDAGNQVKPAPAGNAAAAQPPAPEDLRVLVIAHVGWLRDRMDKSHYLRYEALARLPGVSLFGPGLPGYRPGLSLRQAVEVACSGRMPHVILHGCDLRESGVPLVSELEDAPALRAVELLDSWANPQRQVEFIRRHRFDLGLIQEAGPHLEFYRASCPQTEFVWVPNAVDTRLFYHRRLPREYDVILYGLLDEQVYPFRCRLARLLAAQSDLRFRHILHPGYYPDSGTPPDRVIAGAELSREINRAWIGIATQSVFGCLLMKYLEIPASYALVAGDVPEHGRPLLGDDYLPLEPGQSDEEILTRLQEALADKDRLLEQIDRVHDRVMRHFSTDAFAARVLGLFRQALARRAVPSGGRVPGPAPSSAPTAAPAGAQYPDRAEVRLSLCMIARDNAGTIAACLESIRPHVDEMIVVDTGSRDETPRIAERLGARVFHFPWCDDFSAARNESLRYACGEWIFWMDSDDTIDPECGRRLRELIHREVDRKIMGYVVSVHCPGPGEDSDVTVVQHVKLFRNYMQLRFDGRIHEQLIPAIRALDGQIAWTDLFVVHSGYDHSPEGQRRKLERDLRLLSMELDERPDHPFTLFNLAMTCTDAGRYQEAIGYARRSIAHSPEGASHLRKAFAYLVSCHDRLGQPEAAWEACLEGLKQFPLDDELRFRKAALLHGRGQLKEAVQTYIHLLEVREEVHFSSVVAGIAGHLARHNLALVYRDLGDLPHEEEQWRRVVEEKPHYRLGWRGLGDVLVRAGKYAEAQTIAERLLGDVRLQGEGRLIRSALACARGDYRTAREELEQALAERPDDADLWQALCRLLFERGEAGEAERALRELVKRSPEDASAYHNLGTVCLRLHHPHDAIEAFQQALRLRPEAAHTHLHLGYALKEAGRREEACAAWEAALHLEPDNRGALEEVRQARGSAPK